MRKVLFWSGWTLLILLPIAFLVEIWWIQDLPTLQSWRWVVPAIAFALIVLGRNRDDVLNHHIPAHKV